MRRFAIFFTALAGFTAFPVYAAPFVWSFNAYIVASSMGGSRFAGTVTFSLPDDPLPIGTTNIPVEVYYQVDPIRPQIGWVGSYLETEQGLTWRIERGAEYITFVPGKPSFTHSFGELYAEDMFGPGTGNFVRANRMVVDYGSTIPQFAWAVPEPATWALMIFGIGAVGWRFRRRSTGSAVLA